MIMLLYQRRWFTLSSVFLVSWGGMRLGTLCTSATIWPIVPALVIDDECAAVGGMRIGREN
jgi:hypothetical protein